MHDIDAERGSGIRGASTEVACAARATRIHEVVIDACMCDVLVESRHLQHGYPRARAGDGLGDIGERRPTHEDLVHAEIRRSGEEVDQRDVQGTHRIRGRIPAAAAGAPACWPGSAPTACRICAGDNATRPSHSGCVWPTTANAGPARWGNDNAAR